MERSGNCGCSASKMCKAHEGCAKKCNDCKCGCKSQHPCKECKSCHSESAKPKKS